MVRGIKGKDVRGRTKQARHDEHIHLKKKRKPPSQEQKYKDAQRHADSRQHESHEQADRQADQQEKRRKKRKRKMTADERLQAKADEAERKRQTRRSSELGVGVEDILRDINTAVNENVEENTETPASAAESIFWASSGLDKSALLPEEMLQTGCDVEQFNDETYCSKLERCAGCGAIFVDKGSSQREAETIFRKEIAAAFSFENTQECNSERGVRTRIDGKVLQLQLIKDLVTKDGHFFLCNECSTAVKAKTKSVLWTIDLGQTSDLPQLTPVEKACIAGSRMYGTVVKIKEKLTTDTQPLQMKGHFICFPHDSIQKLSTVIFPRSDIEETVQVHFIGSRAGWEKMQPLLVSAGGLLEVRLRVLEIWLLFLQQTNKFYKHIKVDFSEEKAKRLHEAVEAVMKTALITVDPTLENAIGSTLGKDVEDTGFPSVVVDPQGAKKDMLEGSKEAAKILFPKESGAAINEFDENEVLLGTLFPWIFATGNIPREGNMRQDVRRCLLLRYDHRVEREPTLIFLLYNQMQRHSFSRNVAHADAAVATKLNALCGNPTFEDEIKKIRDGAKGTRKTAKLRNFLIEAINIGQNVTPFSHGECVSFYLKLISELRFRGSPSVWLTMSPSAMENSFCLRLCFGSDYTGKEEYAIRSSKVLESPAMTALFFEVLTHAIEEHLLRIPGNKKKTRGPYNEQPGVFGPCSAYCRAVESQARTLLHFHALLWTALSPEVIQQSIHLSNELLEGILKHFDECMTTSMSEDFWKFSNEAWTKCERHESPSLKIKPDFELSRDYWAAASSVELHRHAVHSCAHMHMQNSRRLNGCWQERPGDH